MVFAIAACWSVGSLNRVFFDAVKEELVAGFEVRAEAVVEDCDELAEFDLFAFCFSGAEFCWSAHLPGFSWS